jgi:hypothetical protein
VRRAVRFQGDDLAVEDRFAYGQRAHVLDDLGDRSRDLAQVAREHPDVIAGLVDLNASAIELPFEREIVRDGGPGLVEIGGRLRQHRLDRLKDLNGESLQPRLAVDERRVRHRRKRAGHHRRSPDSGRGYVARAGHRFEQHAFERALSELAHQQPGQEVLFLAGGFAQQIAQQARPLSRRPSSSRTGDPSKGLVHVDERERGSVSRFCRLRLPDRRVPQSHPPLTRLAGKKTDGDVDFLRGESPKERGEMADLHEPAARFRDSCARRHQAVKKHRRK